MTGKVLEALDVPEFSDLAIDVVVGATSPHRATIKRQVSKRLQTVLHEPRPHLADLMAQSDLAIGAAGITTWERLCLRLPTLVISVADNQVMACQALQHQGLIQYLGMAGNLTVEELQIAISSFLQNPLHLVEMAAQASLQVDGLGSRRVLEHLKNFTHH
jgi:spore coat polysaccharide biosynthesis predicted glycosyltransferase SpsG